jgi:hypothetical protein
MPRWREWLGGRSADPRAAAYVAVLWEEPRPEDVQWLAAHGTAGDADHARWELRYARLALGQLAAQRDALDDQTASLVASEIARAFTRDPSVADEKRTVAEQQFNTRLRAYGDALLGRAGEGGVAGRLGRILFDFAGRREDRPGAMEAHAAEVLTGYLADANDALRRQFGAAELPDDVVPSSLHPGRR